MSKPRKQHWIVVKRVFIYMCGMIAYAICYGGEPKDNKENNVHGFIDSDRAGDIEHRRLTGGYVFNIFGKVVSWMSKRHLVIAPSSMVTDCKGMMDFFS